MSFLLSFLRSFRGVAAVVGGRDAFQQTARMLHTARLALIGFAVSSILLSLCLIIISVYFAMQIANELTA